MCLHTVPTSLPSPSNANAHKLETELEALRENNARLAEALQESNNGVEMWKQQLAESKQDGDQLRAKVTSCHLTQPVLQKQWHM